MTATGPATPERSFSSTRSGAVRTAYKALRPWFWQIASAALGVGFVLAVFRPWEAMPRDPTADDIAVQWNNSVGKLGIEPVFPPEEDIYVGDIFAIITGVGADADAKTFIGSSVRLDHVNVRWAFDHTGDDLPVFPTTAKKTDDKAVLQDEKEENTPAKYASSPITMEIAAFPGVTITHATKSSAFLGLSLGGSTAQREGAELEEIHIPVAETYGISTPDAVSALDAWCSNAATSKMCTRDFAQRMLRFVLGTDVLDDKKNKGGNPPTIGLLLVDRVYAAREFDTRRVTSTSRNGSLHVVAVPSAQKNTPEKADEKSSPDADKAGQDPDEMNGSSMSTAQSFGTSEGIQQIFSRPVVFGMRSVKRDLN